MWIKASFPAFTVFDVNGRRPLPRPDSADCAKTCGTASHFAFHAQALFAISINEKLGCAVAIRRIHIRSPKVGRLYHVTICIDDIIGATHRGFLLRAAL